jgi:hypothetical protein
VALVDILVNTPEQLAGKKVDQVIRFAGEGRLLDGNNCSREFRDYLAEAQSNVLARYAEECLSERFEDSGCALQDVLNEVGRRIGSRSTTVGIAVCQTR